MTARMYYDADADPAALAGRRIAVLGLRLAGPRPRAQPPRQRCTTSASASPRRAAARDGEGRRPDVSTPVAEAAREADVVMVLTPGHGAARRSTTTRSRRTCTPGKTLMFAHGFNIRFGTITPPRRTSTSSMVAPKGPGTPRAQHVRGGPGRARAVAVHQDATGKASERALAYARGIGGTRAGVLETTFAEETETDLFGEQAVLCGGVSALVKAGFETLIEAGYQPEVAYFECLHELKLIVDLMYRGGLTYMRYSVSDTAEYGDYVSGPRVVDRAHPRDDAASARRDPGRAPSRALDRGERGRTAATSSRCATRSSTCPSSRWARSCAAMMPGSTRDGPGMDKVLAEPDREEAPV